MTLKKMTPAGEAPMTGAEVTALLTDQAALSARIRSAAAAASARAALDASDRVAVRCLKAGVPYPAAWLAYDGALRDALRTGEGTLPDRPAYPEGT